jgi:hypothetical protein
MSARNQHELAKLVIKEGSNVTDEELTFKKPFQTVRRPPTTDHNIHDDYVKHPPHVRGLRFVQGVVLNATIEYTWSRCYYL